MDEAQIILPPEIRRRRFSAADVQAMIDAEVIRHDERIELIAGELIEKPKLDPQLWHAIHVLTRWVLRNLPDELTGASQGPLRLSAYNEPEPELFAFSDSLRVNDVCGPDTILVIEVAMATLKLDLGVKARIYAEHGVPEYWVVDLANARTLVHRLGGDGTYVSPRQVVFDDPLQMPGGRSLVMAKLDIRG